MNSDGSYLYLPSAGFTGLDSFGFAVSNGSETATATVHIDVYNTAPNAGGAAESALHDRPFSSFVGAYDMDGDTLSFSVSAAPTHGTVTMDSWGGYTYTPNPNYVGGDSFNFAVSDSVSTTIGTVNLDV